MAMRQSGRSRTVHGISGSVPVSLLLPWRLLQKTRMTFVGASIIRRVAFWSHSLSTAGLAAITAEDWRVITELVALLVDGD